MGGLIILKSLRGPFLLLRRKSILLGLIPEEGDDGILKNKKVKARGSPHIFKNSCQGKMMGILKEEARKAGLTLF